MAISELDVKRLVNERFGGRTALLHSMQARGAGVHSRKTIDKWIERGRIPGEYWPALHAICSAQGRSLDLARFQAANRVGSAAELF